MDNDVIIFSDGSSIGNPGPGGFGAVIFFKKENKIVEIGGKEDNTTNNRMEIMAAMEGISMVPDGLNIKVYTDSKYLIQGITSWIINWKNNGWKTKEGKSVLNQDLWERLSGIVSNKNIEWNHLEGHAGIVGNERADEIANGFSMGKKIELYSGDESKYGLDIMSMTKGQKKTTRGAYSYISMVDGEIKTHQTWPETLERVKGKKAKYKKAMTLEEEKEIIEKFQNDR